MWKRQEDQEVDKQVLDDFKGTRILVIERGNTKSLCVENSLWKTAETYVHVISFRYRKVIG